VTFGAYTITPGPEWTDTAARWPLRWVTRETEAGHWHTDVVHPALAGQTVWQSHLTCSICGQSVACLSPDTSQGGYLITDEMIRAGVLRHIRQAHDTPPPQAG
jgi:hypothetical protein